MRFFQMVPEPEPDQHDGQRPCQDTRGGGGGGASHRRLDSLKRRPWGRCLGRLGTSCAFLCAVAAGPAPHSESLCWALPAPLGGGGRAGGGGTQCASCRKRGPGSPGSQLCASGTHCAPEQHKPSEHKPSVDFCRFSSELKDACHSPALCFLSCANNPETSESPFFSPTLLLPLPCPPNLKLFQLLLSKSHSNAINICRTFPMKAAMPGPLTSIKSAPPPIFLRAHIG